MDSIEEPVAPEEVAALAADVRSWLSDHRGLGASIPTAPVPERLRPAARPSRPKPQSSPGPPASRGSDSRPPGRRISRPAPPPSPLLRRRSEAPPRGVGSPALAAIRQDLGDCRRCKLAPLRTNLVYGVGDPSARIVFVGEGPGYHEDQQGEPFVGAAGELLTRIINNVLRLDRSDVYITNVIKCRPPGNRNPEPDEVAACAPFLHRQLDAIGPAVVVALGRFAIQTLLGSDASVGSLRGRAHPFRGAVLVPTYHPAYLLRNPADKRKTMEDMLLVRSEFERITGAALPPPLSRRPAAQAPDRPRS